MQELVLVGLCACFVPSLDFFTFYFYPILYTLKIEDSSNFSFVFGVNFENLIIKFHIF